MNKDDFKFITNVNFLCLSCGDKIQLKSYYNKKETRCMTYSEISKSCSCGQYKVMVDDDKNNEN